MNKIDLSITLKRIENVREILLEYPEGIILKELAEKCNVNPSILSPLIKNFFEKRIEIINKGKFKIFRLKISTPSKKEKRLIKRKKALEVAKKLRIGGYSYSEISKKIKNIMKFNINERSLSAHLRNVKMCKKGLTRYNKKISKDRIKAGKKGGMANIKSGHIFRIQPLAVKASENVHLKKIPNSSKKLSMEKVKIISHCLFDGCVIKKKGYNVIAYQNKSKKLVDNFIHYMRKVYKMEPTDLFERKSGYVVRFCSKKIVEDLSRYSSYSSSEGNIPKEIIGGSKEWKIDFLKCFWNDEGMVGFVDFKDRYGRRHINRYVEAFQKNKKILFELSELHKSLGINTRINGNKIIISDKKNLELFSKIINFTPNVRVSYPKSKWNGKEKRNVLKIAIESYQNKIKNIGIKTFGCAANISDSQIMKNLLIKNGFRITSLDKSNCLIVNTCGVKSVTEERIMSYLKKLSSRGKKFIIAGCLPKININRIKKEIPKFYAIMDTKSIDKIVDIIKKLEMGKSGFIFLSEKFPNKPKMIVRIPGQITGIVQISEGCNLKCSYCATRFGRGKLNCFSPKDIGKSINHLVKGGCKEIFITSQDNASYKCKGFRLPELLKMVVGIKGNFRIRVGMMNPAFVKPILSELVRVYKNPKIYKFIHIPVQSGSDRVLRKMRRGYETKEFERIVKEFRKFPYITLSTDIIVGFPGERESDFRKTTELIKRIRPDIVNISKFSPRPRTEASRMKQLDSKIVKNRSKRLAALVKRIGLEKNRSWVSKECEILITERGKRKNQLTGRNESYKPVVVEGKGKLLGKFLKVKITEFGTAHLKAEIIRNSV